MPTPLRDAHAIVAAVRQFVDKEVVPAASALEHADAYPQDLVARMRDLGLFGALVPEAYGGLGLDVATYARVIEEICRGFMSLAGVINSHTMAALIVLRNGTDEQKGRLLPRFAAGTARGGLCLTEPHAGSDVQAICTVARRSGDSYLISGSKMFVTNGREGNTFALLALTDPAASPRHKGMSCFIVEKGAGDSKSSNPSPSSATRAWIRPSSSSTTSPARLPISWAGSKGGASNTSCRGSRPAASTSPRAPSESVRRRWRKPHAAPSACPSHPPPSPRSPSAWTARGS